MDTVNEKTTSYLKVDFKDKDNLPTVPQSILYSVMDKASGTVIRADTAIAPLSTITITLDATDNTIQNPLNKTETRVVTVKASYGSTDKFNDDFEYELVNLTQVL